MSDTLLMMASRSAPATSAPAEGEVDGGQDAEEEQRHREGADGQERAHLLARQVGEDEAQVLHRAASAAAASTSTPLSRCSTTSARSAARGSWVTMSMVFPCSRHRRVEQVQDLVGAPAVEVSRGLVAEEEGGVGHDGAGDGHALLLPAGELPRVVLHAVRQADDAQRRLHVLAGGRPCRAG